MANKPVLLNLEAEEDDDVRSLEKMDAQSAENLAVSETTIVAKIGDAVVQAASLLSLGDQANINDEILEYGLMRAYINCGSPEYALICPVRYWKGYFGLEPKQQSLKVESVYKILKKQIADGNLLKVKYLFIPVCSHSHWFLAVICEPFPEENMIFKIEQDARRSGRQLSCFSKRLYASWLKHTAKPPKVLMFDSLIKVVNEAKEEKLKGFEWYKNVHKDTAIDIVKGLRCLHEEIWRQTGRNFEVNTHFERNNVPYQTMHVGSQSRSPDCGLYCMIYLVFWLKKMEQHNHNYNEMYQKIFDYDPLIVIRKPLQTRAGLIEDILENCKATFPKYYESFINFRCKKVTMQ